MKPLCNLSNIFHSLFHVIYEHQEFKKSRDPSVDCGFMYFVLYTFMFYILYVLVGQSKSIFSNLVMLYINRMQILWRLLFTKIS